MTFFDDPKNRVGILTTRLSTDASLVQGVSGTIFIKTVLTFVMLNTFIYYMQSNEIQENYD